MGKLRGNDRKELEGLLGTFATIGSAATVGSDDFIEVGTHAAAAASVLDSVQQRRSCVLLGESGTGKTAVARFAANKLAKTGWVVFAASPIEANAGQSYVGQLEGRISKVAALTGKGDVVWLMPDAHVALHAGRHNQNPHGLMVQLLPLVEQGKLIIVAESTAASWKTVVHHLPQAATAFSPVSVAEARGDDLREIVVRRSAALGFSADAGEAAIDLAEDHLPARRAPAGPLGLIAQAALSREANGSGDAGSERAEVVAALRKATGLPEQMIDDDLSLDLDALGDHLAARVRGQPEAVRTLTERIAMIKSGLTDPSRPLGVFAFAGPTGTGKTEMAKAVAEWLYGSPDRLVRQDMSELQTADSVDGLLAPSTEMGRRGLLADVRQQPFSVVLLDEFEKAHPRAWDLFLQVFDDGRLTDSAGTTTDFRRCIVIMTTNLGAASAWPTRLGFGGGSAGFEPKVVQRAVENEFRPEFVNRLDRVVVFQPLGRGVMRDLIRKELDEILKRRGMRSKPWAVELDETAIELLIERGFSLEMGARPLKRAIDQDLLAPLAKAIVERSVPDGDQFLFVKGSERGISVEFVDPDFGVVRTPDEPERRDARVPPAIALDPTGAPLERQALATRLEELEARVGQRTWSARKDELLESMGRPEFWDSDQRFEALAEAELRDRIEAGVDGAKSLRRRMIQASRDAAARPVCRLLALRLFVLGLAFEALDANDPQDVFVELTPLDASEAASGFRRDLSDMYRGWASDRGMRIDSLKAPEGRKPGHGSEILSISGFGAARILLDEAGRHFRESGAESESATVSVKVAIQPIQPAHELERVAGEALGQVPDDGKVVRRYRFGPSPLVRDSKRSWRTGRLNRVLAGDFDLFGDAR